jgi:hypothetical protein
MAIPQYLTEWHGLGMSRGVRDMCIFEAPEEDWMV